MIQIRKKQQDTKPIIRTVSELELANYEKTVQSGTETTSKTAKLTFNNIIISGSMVNDELVFIRSSQ